MQMQNLQDEHYTNTHIVLQDDLINLMYSEIDVMGPIKVDIEIPLDREQFLEHMHKIEKSKMSNYLHIEFDIEDDVSEFWQIIQDFSFFDVSEIEIVVFSTQIDPNISIKLPKQLRKLTFSIQNHQIYDIDDNHFFLNLIKSIQFCQQVQILDLKLYIPAQYSAQYMNNLSKSIKNLNKLKTFRFGCEINSQEQIKSLPTLTNNLAQTEVIDLYFSINEEIVNNLQFKSTFSQLISVKDLKIQLALQENLEFRQLKWKEIFNEFKNCIKLEKFYFRYRSDSQDLELIDPSKQKKWLFQEIFVLGESLQNLNNLNQITLYGFNDYVSINKEIQGKFLNQLSNLPKLKILYVYIDLDLMSMIGFIKKSQTLQKLHINCLKEQKSEEEKIQLLNLFFNTLFKQVKRPIEVNPFNGLFFQVQKNIIEKLFRDKNQIFLKFAALSKCLGNSELKRKAYFEQIKRIFSIDCV